jgi:hypothetical protein
MAKCLGLNKSWRRCNRQGDWRFFCKDHTMQPLVWLFSLIFVVGAGSASIFSVFRGRGGTIVQVLPAPSPIPVPTVAPTPSPQGTPSLKTPNKPNRDSQRERTQSYHVRRARGLYDQGKYQEALRECDVELSMNPRNSEAISLRKRILRTMQILNRQ